MDKCTCKITPGTSAYGGNQIDSRGCEKHDTRDEIIEQLRQERDNALRYTELLIAERNAARAGEARAVEACQRIEEALQGTDFADHGLDSPVWNALELVRDVTADEPALDWLAQQRREAAAEALEGIGAKQTSASGPAAQKVETLIFLADTADKLARLDCELIDRAAMAQRAALFRECAAMMRERAKNDPQWTLIDGDYRLKYRGYDLVAFESWRRCGFFTSGVSKKGQGLILFRKMSLPAAQAAAVAWVDEQEGK